MQDTRERGNSKTEPIGPGAKMRKPKVAYGTQGVKTKVPESKLTLQIALKLEKELKKRGYDVYMIRRKQNVNISNKQRAIRANKSGADICIRLHADAASANVRGVSVLYPSQQNPYVAKLSKRRVKNSQRIYWTVIVSQPNSRNVVYQNVTILQEQTGVRFQRH